MGGYPFTGSQAGIVTGDSVRTIVGDEVADRIAARFRAARPDADGNRVVDLGDDQFAVVTALREISPDSEEPSDQHATETLLKRLAGTA